MKSRAWCLVGLVSTGACGGSTLTIVDDPLDAGVEPDAGHEPDATLVDGAATNDAGLPAACVDESPFTSEACAVALAARCHALTSERDCVSEVISGDDSYLCEWAKVTTFSDVATCTVASVEGRCEAYSVTAGLGSCRGPCAWSLSDLDAYPATSVLLQSACRSSTGIVVTGPIDHETIREFQPGGPRERRSCGQDSPPELCACSQVVCGRP